MSCVCVAWFLCLLVQEWSDYCAALGVRLIHQCVQIGQEGVTDVQNVPGHLCEFVIPGNRVLPLMEKEYKSRNYKGRLTTKHADKLMKDYRHDYDHYFFWLH